MGEDGEVGVGGEEENVVAQAPGAGSQQPVSTTSACSRQCCARQRHRRTLLAVFHDELAAYLDIECIFDTQDLYALILLAWRISTCVFSHPR